MGRVKDHFWDEINAQAEQDEVPEPFPPLSSRIRSLARELWLEVQSRSLSDDEIMDLECALSDIDTLMRADADAKAERLSHAAE